MPIIYGLYQDISAEAYSSAYITKMVEGLDALAECAKQKDPQAFGAAKANLVRDVVVRELLDLAAARPNIDVAFLGGAFFNEDSPLFRCKTCENSWGSISDLRVIELFG